MATEVLLQPSGRLNRTDVVKFAYFHHLRRFWLLIGLCLAFSMLGILAVVTSDDPDRLQNPGSAYFFLLVFGLIQLGLPCLSGWRQYSKMQVLREAMRFHITGEKIRLEGPNFSSEVMWPLVQAAYETRNAFLIYQSAQMAWILPKRFFWGDSELLAQGRQIISQSLVKPRRLRSVALLSSWF
jgi:hypothetical protein